LWRSVLFVEETGVSGENHQPVTSYWQTLSHNTLSSTPRLGGIRSHNVSGDRLWLYSTTMWSRSRWPQYIRWRCSYQEKVGIPLTGFSPPHVCVLCLP
jgi:hypothetical protein